MTEIKTVKVEVKFTEAEFQELQQRIPGGEDFDRTVVIRKLLGLPKKIQRNPKSRVSKKRNTR